MPATSSHSKQFRSGRALDGSHRLARRMRPSTTPAYYNGRLASEWISIFRRTIDDTGTRSVSENT
jgi:hypothetical protein